MSEQMPKAENKKPSKLRKGVAAIALVASGAAGVGGYLAAKNGGENPKPVKSPAVVIEPTAGPPHRNAIDGLQTRDPNPSLPPAGEMYTQPEDYERVEGEPQQDEVQIEPTTGSDGPNPETGLQTRKP